MEIRRAIEFDDTIREKICKIFIDTYRNGLKLISQDTTKLIKALEHMFLLENIYVAIMNKEIAGIIGYTDNNRFSIKYKKRILIKHLGIIKGLLANNIVKHFFNKYPNHSIETDKKIMSIEFFAMSSKYQKLGFCLK